jgi:hypothetical protein
MDCKKFMLLLLFSALFLAGCLDWLNPPAHEEYEIFSNLPTENAKALIYMKFTEEGTNEFKELFGTILTGNALKKSQESEAGVVIYNDSFGFISYSKTNMTMEDVIDEINSSIEEKMRDKVRIEAKNVAGKEITMVYLKSGDVELPICLWKDGDILKALMMFNFPQTTPLTTSAFASEPASPLIGYALQVASQGQGSSGNTCDAILGKRYDTGNAKALFKDAEYIKSSIPVSGKLFGEFKAYAGDNPLLNGSIYGVIFGDDNADNLVVAGKMNFTNPMMTDMSNNYCASSATSSFKSSIVQSNGKEACMQEGKTTLLTINAQFITLQRKVGDYSIFVLTYIKDKKDVARENAKDIVFSTNLPGTDATWTDKANIEVKVYDEAYSAGFEHTPLAEARVDLFSGAYYSSVSEGKLIKSLYTNESGSVRFENVSLNESLYLVASKAGYENQSRYVYSSTTSVVIYLKKVNTNLGVRVYEYGTSYGSSANVNEARVKVYSGSKLLGENYTNYNGEATIQNVENGDVRIEVSKEGYEDEVESLYVGRYSRDTSVYLTPKLNMSVLANGTMSEANHLCTQVNVSSAYYRIRAKFTSLNDTYSRWLMYGIDCPNAYEISYGCSTSGCSSGGKYCYITTASKQYTTSGIVMNTTPGAHTICIWPSSPGGYNWVGQLYGENFSQMTP